MKNINDSVIISIVIQYRNNYDITAKDNFVQRRPKIIN